jgi:hypothetical protein
MKPGTIRGRGYNRRVRVGRARRRYPVPGTMMIRGRVYQIVKIWMPARPGPPTLIEVMRTEKRKP